MSEDKYKRCGKCCYYPYAGKMKRCKYLVDLDNGLTKCIIYHKLYKEDGTKEVITIDVTPEGHPVMCLTREQTKFWIPGCPYNKTVWLRNKNSKREVKL